MIQFFLSAKKSRAMQACCSRKEIQFSVFCRSMTVTVRFSLTCACLSCLACRNHACFFTDTRVCCVVAELANLLAKVFVPGFTSDTLRELAAKQPDKFVVAETGGILGIEEVLDKVEDHVGSFVLG